MATMRCKLKLIEIREHCHYKVLIFKTEYDQTIPAEQRFCKETPSGNLELTLNNPLTYNNYTVGNYYYLDISTVPVAVANAAVGMDTLTTKPHVHAREPGA